MIPQLRRAGTVTISDKFNSGGKDPGTRLTKASSQDDRMGIGRTALYFALLIQGLATGFFSWGIWSGLFGRLDPATPPLNVFIQTFAAVGLIVGTATGVYYLRMSERRIGRLDSQIQAATGNYQTHLEDLFRQWSLSTAERAIAILAMKGFSNAEIAGLRKISVPTVKTHMKAVFRKTGLDNRQQLIAFLVEELLSGIALQPPEDEPAKTEISSQD
jgi:DNA-binding CsgD family transcriptional regulator